MKVSELIEFLKTQPQDLTVVFRCYSEHAVLKANEINIQELCPPRADGWVHDARPDKPLCRYLVLPGN